jgi:hypothetical protein
MWNKPTFQTKDMMMRGNSKSTDRFKARAIALAATATVLGGFGSAHAFEIDTGNEDVTMRLDNKVGFTAGWRVGERDTTLAANPAHSVSVASDYFADKGDLYTTRFDLYSEFDLKYKNDHGIRLSASLWSDPSFPSRPNVGPAGVANSSFGPTGQWPDSTKRYYGTSGEMLDAFAFTRQELGSVPVNIKLGRTSVVWGESVFGGVGGINSMGYAQNPNDGRKSTQNPNASLKETSLPLAQANAVFNVTDNANLSLYRAFEFRPDRVPDSGTYMGFSDGVAGAPNLLCSQHLPYGCFPYGAPLNGKNDDWGIQYKVRPSFVDASFAVAYREFAEKAPWYGVWNVANNFPIGEARSVYGNNTQLLGVSFNTTKADISWAGELNYRKNAALVSDFSALAPVALGGRNGPGGSFSVSPTEGARGDTLHALLNAQMVFGRAAFWDTLTVAAEVAVNHLDKVTKNANLFQASGSGYAPVLCNAPPAFGGAVNRKVAGCADSTATSFGLFVSPTIYQVAPSVDLEIPLFMQFNSGNSPLNGGSTSGFNTYSLGLKATWNTAHGPQVFQLSYLKFTNNTDINNPTGHTILGAPYYDRAQVLFTYTTSF